MLRIGLILVLALTVGVDIMARPLTSETARPPALDLRHMVAERDVINLDGRWEFFWDQIVQPGEDGTLTGLLPIAGNWLMLSRRHLKQYLPGTGVAS